MKYNIIEVPPESSLLIDLHVGAYFTTVPRSSGTIFQKLSFDRGGERTAVKELESF